MKVENLNLKECPTTIKINLEECCGRIIYYSFCFMDGNLEIWQKSRFPRVERNQNVKQEIRLGRIPITVQ